jgi:hypothetical protein
MKDTVAISQKIIESDMTDVEFYLYVLFKTMKEDELTVLTSIKKLSSYIGHKDYAVTEKEVKFALKSLVVKKLITCLLIPMTESNDIEPTHLFEVVFNYETSFDEQSQLFAIDKLLLTDLLQLKYGFKIHYLRNYFQLLIQQNKLENLTDGNKQR